MLRQGALVPLAPVNWSRRPQRCSAAAELRVALVAAAADAIDAAAARAEGLAEVNRAHRGAQPHRAVATVAMLRDEVALMSSASIAGKGPVLTLSGNPAPAAGAAL